jgi:hypothetical protein
MTVELDPEIVARIQARARADRALVDRYNAEVLRSQGIEPTPEHLQAMCGENIAAALAAEAERKRQASNA